MISDKDRHEAFVSGHVGSNEWHIQLTVLAAQLGPILFSCARATFAASRALATPSRRKRESGNGTKPEECAATFPADFACVVLPMLLAFTLPDQVPALVFAEVCALAILVAIGSFRPYSPQPLRQRATPKSAPTVPAPETTATRKPQSSVIAAYRAMAMVSIVFVILAVDFRVFPRHHAKTETFGTSMMDAGVGSLAFSAGLASKPPNSLAAVVPRTIPLLILGALRTLAVKATDYHEHVSEYGVHWNFFLTLAGILLLDGLFTRLLARTPSLFKDNARPWMGWWLAGVFLAFAHEVLLKGFGLLDFVLHADRSSSWIAANKEGVISLMGYLGLFFLGRAHGAGIHLREASRGLALFRAAGCIALLATIYAILPGVCGLDPPSRRVVNASYICWVVLYNEVVIFIFAVGDLIHSFLAPATSSEYTTPLERAVNRNQLFVFLLGNLLTGLTNKLIITVDVPDHIANVVLLFYMLCVLGLASWLDSRKVTLKAW